jgi:hypothetical protein
MKRRPWEVDGHSNAPRAYPPAGPQPDKAPQDRPAVGYIVRAANAIVLKGSPFWTKAIVIEPSHSILSLSLRIYGAFYMFVTEEEAAEIYAKACRSRYREEAKLVVNSKIRALKAKGDSKGVRAWTLVRHSLERQEQSVN